MTTAKQPDPPAGLSRASQRVWQELTALHAFEPHELIAFDRALGWWDRSDTWLAASDKVEGRERSQLIEQSLDAGMAALRHWRTLKFLDPTVPKRRPGRPSGDDWSAQRKALKAAI